MSKALFKSPRISYLPTGWKSSASRLTSSLAAAVALVHPSAEST